MQQNVKSKTSKFEQVIIKTAKNSAWLRNTFKIIDFKAGPECGTYDFMTVHANNVQTRWQVKCVRENPSRVMPNILVARCGNKRDYANKFFAYSRTDFDMLLVLVASKDNKSQITAAYYADMKRLIDITSNNDTHSVNDTCILQNSDYKELNKIEGQPNDIKFITTTGHLPTTTYI